jgi:LDH2 family malate/lactate/ureidoglycolate dehydrogenase
MTEPSIAVDFARLSAFAAAAFERLGLPAADAGTVTTLMAEADLQGSDGHGIMRLPQYAQRIKARVDTLVRDLRGSRRMPGVERIWLPGEQSQAKRVAYAREGIPIATGLMRNLNQLAVELGIAGLA